MPSEYHRRKYKRRPPKPVPPAPEDVAAIVRSKVQQVRARLTAFEQQTANPHRRFPIVRDADHYRARLGLLIERYERDLAWVMEVARSTAPPEGGRT